jgi:hypothetical protein
MTQTDVTKASWVATTVYGFNNGVVSTDFQSVFEYAAADPVMPVITSNEFYMQVSGNTVYWWKIADTYTNTHLLAVRLDRYVGGTYISSYYEFFYPFVYTVTSNLSGYPNNPSNLLKYSWNISSLPSGTYFMGMIAYNYNYGYGVYDQAVNYVGTSNPFTR